MAKEKRMTKQEALEISIKMWDWLAEHPEANKLTAIHRLNLDARIIEVAGCAACYYASQQQDAATTDKYVSRCVYCPIWTKAVSCSRQGCISWGSPFKKWSGSVDSLARSVAATSVANMARKELSKLLKRKEADKIRRSAK